MTNLHRRQITDLAVCELCKGLEEDTLHATWSCGEIACVWNSFTWFHQAFTSPPPPTPTIRFPWLVFQIFAGTRWLQLWNFLYHSLANLEPEKHAAFWPTSSPSRKSLLHGRKLIARIPSCLGVWTNPSPSSYATAVASSRSWSFQVELWCSGIQLIEFGKHWRYYSWLAWCRDWSFVHAHFSYTFSEWSGGNSLSQSSSVCQRTWTSENYFWRQFVDGDQCPFTRAWPSFFIWECHWWHPHSSCWFLVLWIQSC